MIAAALLGVGAVVAEGEAETAWGRRNSSDGKYYSGAWSRKTPREDSGDNRTENLSGDAEEKFFDPHYEYLMVGRGLCKDVVLVDVVAVAIAFGIVVTLGSGA